MFRLERKPFIILALACLSTWSWPFVDPGYGAVSTIQDEKRPQAAENASAATAHLANGQRAFAAGKFQEARAALELAVRADPKLAEAYLGLGLLDLQSSDAAAAIRRFRRAVELAPRSFQGHYHLAMSLLREQKLQEGAQELERALAIDPRHTDALYNLGVVLLELNRPEEALSRLRQAREQGSGRPDIAFNLVRAELAADRTGDARLEADNAAKTFGTDAAWRKSVGGLFLQYRQPREAIVHLSEAARLEPDSAEIRRQLAAAYIEAGDPGRALALLETGTEAEDHYMAASAYLVLHRLPEADRESRLALEKEPRDPRYLLQMARIDQRTGRHEESLELLRQASQIDHDWAEPYYSAGVTLYLLHRYADARQSLDRALQLDPRSVRALFLYSATLANQGQNREGEEVLLRAIALEPSNARLYYHLGAIRLRDNRAAEAEPAFQKAIQLKPDYGPPHYQLGKLLARANQPEQAVQELEAAVRYQSDLAQAYYQLARVYARLGRTEESERALSTFNEFKKQEESPDTEFTDAVQKELQPPDRE
jgi:tetratricopeptide (TPR) repeat protein